MEKFDKSRKQLCEHFPETRANFAGSSTARSRLLTHLNIERYVV